MKTFTTLISIVLVWALSLEPCLGFGTGTHFDLTRMVLAEHGFADTPLKIAQVENWLTDYYANTPTVGDKDRAVLEKLHFDNLFDEEQVRAYWAVLLRNLRSSTEKAARENDRLAMLVTLGIGLHAVQDFYAHSNWAELHPPRDKNEFRSETFVRIVESPQEAMPKGLHTGKYPDGRTSGPGAFPVPTNADVHGSYHSGLNKDSPSRPHWDEAFVFAYAASHELVGAMESWAERVRPGFWRSIREYTVDAASEKKLDFDVSAARNMSMWLKGKGQDGTWKGEGSGSTRFFTKFSGNWITEDSSVFVKAMRDGGIKEALAVDLYSPTKVDELPKIEPFSLQRTAVLIDLTYVAESTDKNAFQRALTSSLGGPDLYSRIKAGGQEFWGRTMQASRETIDPWYEILITDPSATEIPIVISVWDEDHTDPVGDAHVDINPAPGRFDLDLVYHVRDASLTGDLAGVFSSPATQFRSEGKAPEKSRAVIRGFITQREVR